MTLLLLPVNTELLKVSLGEKERQLSHHTLHILDSVYAYTVASYAHSIYARSLQHIRLCVVYMDYVYTYTDLCMCLCRLASNP